MDAVLEVQPANADAIFDELLRTISEALDVRAMFPRVSEVLSRILPHDRLSMTFHDGQGHVAIEAASNDDFPIVDRITVDAMCVRALTQPFLIASDLTSNRYPSGSRTISTTASSRWATRTSTGIAAVVRHGRWRGFQRPAVNMQDW